MKTSTPGATGFLASFRALGDGLLGMVQDRLQLISVELHEEKFRLIQIFIWISAAVFTAMMAIMFASVTVVYLFWESARPTALGGVTLLYSVALIVIITAFRRYLARQPLPFAASLQEIGKDRVCIQTTL